MKSITFLFPTLTMKTTLIRLTLLCICTNILLVDKSFSWNAVGHQVSAYIAWQHMNPAVRERVFQTIMEAPEDSDLSKVYDRFNSRSDGAKKLEQFMFASYWSDVVRNRDFENRHKTYNQGNWHYSDIFWKQEDGKAVILKNFDGSGGIAIPKLEDFDRVMSGSSYPDDEKALAIAWFLHVGGDIHNPVHNASRVTENSPEGDQGGNRFAFRPRTETDRGLNLHAYWDSIISIVHPRKNDEGDVRYIRRIGKKFMKKYEFKDFENDLKLGKYREWNMEGFSYLNDYVYNDIERNKMPSKKYRKRTYKLARKQIALAGYRLGETLNRIFEMPKGVSLKDCKIIRKVLYPVSKRRTPEQKPTVALLNVCPPNLGRVARPTTQLSPDSMSLEYDVVRTFSSADEAKAFARKNRIQNVIVE